MEKTAKDKGEDLAAQCVDDVSKNNLYAETEHPLDGAKVNRQRRTPWNITVAAKIQDGNIDDLLPC